MSEIINRVAQSPILTIDLEEMYPMEERVVFDLKPFLFQELILKEKDFRSELKGYDWSQYQNKWVAIGCSVDAIVPNWAYMLVTTYLHSVAKGYVIGTVEELEVLIANQCLDQIDPSSYEGRPVVIKGCSDFPIPLYAYGKLMTLVQPFARSIMYGEPCSTVPLFKKQKS